MRTKKIVKISFSSCFQIITDDYTPKETEILLKDESNEQLQNIYQKYNVQAVQVSASEKFFKIFLLEELRI